MKTYQLQRCKVGKSFWTDLPNNPKWNTLIGARSELEALSYGSDYEYRILELSPPLAFGNGLKTYTKVVS